MIRIGPPSWDSNRLWVRKNMELQAKHTDTVEEEVEVSNDAGTSNYVGVSSHRSRPLNHSYYWDRFSHTSGAEACCSTHM